MAALNRGDGPAHDTAIADAAAQAGPCDALLLGQFSMARAAAVIAPIEGRQVVALQGSKVLRGTACGIDPDGALRLDNGQRVQRIVSASIRLEPDRISA